jgi:hypothetical protein
MATGYLTEQNIQVSRGLIRGAVARNIFGYQASVTTSFIPAWEFASVYAYPGSAITMTVTSASGSDDGKTLLIQGLDANYAEISDVVTINGAGDINTNIPFFRINDVILTSGTTNVGLITIQNTGKTVNYAGIRAGDGRNQASIYTVPANKEFYLYRIDAFSNDSTAAKPGLFKNFSQNSNGQQYNVARTTFYNQMNIQRRIPFKYSEKTDIQFQLQTASGTHEMNVFGEGILVDVPRTMKVS